MAKPKTPFIEAFEPILISAWGSYQDTLDGSLLEKTRLAISYIRRVYRFKGESGAEAPSHLDFKDPKNRAGYLGAFGERHAYLSYAHLKKVQESSPDAIPQLDKNGELTVTLVGAGPAIETYGLCLFYNKDAHRLKRLNLNLIERVREWQPTRETVFTRLINEVWPKVQIFREDIAADLKEENCVQTFASHHDSLVRTQILFIYNVLNEIEAQYAAMVLRNMGYIIRQCEQSLLILLAEPSAPKAWPRIKWLRNELLEHYKPLLDEQKAVLEFSEEPTRVAFEGAESGLNDRLFGESPLPRLETSLKRVLLACKMVPVAPFSSQHYEQLRSLQLRRDRKGRIVAQEPATDYQLPLFEFK